MQVDSIVVFLALNIVSLLKRSNERKQVFNEYKAQKGKEERVGLLVFGVSVHCCKFEVLICW